MKPCGDSPAHDAGRALEPLDEAAAQAMTAGIREAIADVRRSVAVLAERVRAAHEARVWVALGYGSWAAYAAAEFGVSRAQAYRLIDISHAAGAISAAVTAAEDPVSHTRDTGATPALDFGLSQRALLAVAGRVDEVAALISSRLAAVATVDNQGQEQNGVRAIVQQAVHDVRIAPRPHDELSPDPAVAELQRAVDQLAASNHAIGELMLEVAPAYLSEAQAAERLALLCEEIGDDLDRGLAARRFALTGDRRALHGTVL